MSRDDIELHAPRVEFWRRSGACSPANYGLRPASHGRRADAGGADRGPPRPPAGSRPEAGGRQGPLDSLVRGQVAGGLAVLPVPSCQSRASTSALHSTNARTPASAGCAATERDRGPGSDVDGLRRCGVLPSCRRSARDQPRSRPATLTGRPLHCRLTWLCRLAINLDPTPALPCSASLHTLS